MVNNLNSELKEVVSNISELKEIVNIIPPDVLSSLETLILIIKAAGVVLIIYIIFLIIKGYFDIKKSIRIKYIFEKVNEINEKIDKLLSNKNLKKKKFK